MKPYLLKQPLNVKKKVKKRIKKNRPGWHRHPIGLARAGDTTPYLKHTCGIYHTYLEHCKVCFPICSWLINSYTIGNNDKKLYVTDEAVATKTDM